MKADFKQIEFAPGRIISLETGRLAKQAHGSVVARQGDTMVLATAVSNYAAKEGQSFFPLTVEFRESYAAAGRFPGGYLKREGRSSEKEILSSRLIDRTIRPLFPDTYMNETQVIVQVISADGQNDADVLGGVAASAALVLSDIPFFGPIAEVRVGQIDGAFVINPTVDELKKSSIDMIIGGNMDSILMVEGEMSEVSEETMIAAIQAGHDAIKILCQFQIDLAKEFGKEKRAVEEPVVDTVLNARVAEVAGSRFYEISKSVPEKKGYSAAIDELVAEIKTALAEEFPDRAGDIAEAAYSIQKSALRDLILNEKHRLDGRKPNEIRPIWTEVGYLPRVHGSAVFTRGETQALVSVTLGSKRDEQMVDGLFETDPKRFMLNYNFPPFCTGEAKMLRGQSRREVGHGHLAERALKKLIPSAEAFGYTVRVVSDILESNGSSSMASVCGGSMALMDAGVPIAKPVAGIAMGMVVGEGKKTVVLSDIQGQEDFMGDMDFKVCGTADGITACQMDMKVRGIDFPTMTEALYQAKEGRMHILAKMAETISISKSELSQYAPQMLKIEIDADTIGAVIGPGGKVIQGLQRETGTEIIIEEVNGKGIVTISSNNAEAAQAAKKRIAAITGQLEEGEVFMGTVKSIKDFGAFVEIAPGRDGLLHISEIDHKRISRVEEVLREGDKIEVKLLKIEQGGKLRLSRKALLPKEE